MARYCLSDIHGCLFTFKEALKSINFSKKDILIIIGDMIDRHINSKGVIDLILKMRKEGYTIICLSGNHEDMLIRALWGDREQEMNWFYNGGGECLKSYGYVDAGYTTPHWSTFIPDEHKQFLMELPLIHAEYPDYVFVHAGLDFWCGDPVKDSIAYTMVWERYFTVNNSKLDGRMLITGHTPTHREDIIDMVNGGSHAIIDNGCVYKKDVMNHLTVFNLDDFELTFVKNCEEEE